MSDKGPNDLEEQLRIEKQRNEFLHKHVDKLEDELRDLRYQVGYLKTQLKETKDDNRRLVSQIEDQIKQYRNKGLL